MLPIETVQTIASIGSGLILASGMLVIWMRVNTQSVRTARAIMQEAEESITFLFEDDHLIDATPKAKALMDHRDKRRSDWENLLTLLSARFPHLRTQCIDLAEIGRKTIRPDDGATGWIEAEHFDGLARLTLVQEDENPEDTIDALTASAMEHELQTLRSIGENSPQLIWKRDADGVLVWANRAYIELSEAINGLTDQDALPWPPHEVFPNIELPRGSAPLIDMHHIAVPGHDKPVWYEVTSLKRGSDTMHFAIDASAEVFAREARQSFVQTLTKTFAQLSVGLAIFDSERRLVLFNPALSDLTGLQPEFLIGRPTLYAFLDRLRDTNMIPEPKDYASWRNQMTELENAAVEGSYHETWPLPNGQTFRVTGRPHPNKAVAFLIEDISDEVSLNRRFRTQIDISNAIIDNLKEAVAVFSASGALVLSNKSYQELWGTSSEGLLANRDFTDEMDAWEAISAPSPVWLKLRETLALGATEQSWHGNVWLDSHVELTCQYAPLPDGQHQITFFTALPDPEDVGTVEQLEFDREKA